MGGRVLPPIISNKALIIHEYLVRGLVPDFVLNKELSTKSILSKRKFRKLFRKLKKTQNNDWVGNLLSDILYGAPGERPSKEQMYNRKLLVFQHLRKIALEE